MVQIPRHGLFLIALPFVHGLIIPADLGDIKFNDYGLSEAQTLAQAEWAATGIIPEWALSIYPLLQTENSLHHTNEDRPETEKHQEDGSGPINKRNNNIEGDDYHDVIPPIGNTFPNGEVFVPLPGLPGTMGTGLLKAADEMEEGTVDARGAQEGQTLGGEICDGGSDDTISRRDIVGEEEMYAHNQVLQTPAGQVYLEPHTLARRETNSGQAPSIVAERPTVIDWWTIGGPQFLKAYMTDWAGTNFTEKHGVFGSLAGCYGLVKGDSKNPEDVCAQLRAALGEESVEHVSFVLTAVKNFVALSDLIYVWHIST